MGALAFAAVPLAGVDHGWDLVAVAAGVAVATSALAVVLVTRGSPARLLVPAAGWLLTAKVQPSDTARFEDLDVQAVLAKPFDPMRLADQVAVALG